MWDRQSLQHPTCKHKRRRTPSNRSQKRPTSPPFEQQECVRVTHFLSLASCHHTLPSIIKCCRSAVDQSFRKTVSSFLYRQFVSIVDSKDLHYRQRLTRACWKRTRILRFDHSIGLEAFQAFAKMLERNSTLTKLCIGDLTMGDDGVAALCSALAVNE